jgi:hypothetical protein
MQTLIDLGVDGMFTNFPDRLDALLEGRDPRHDRGEAGRGSVRGLPRRKLEEGVYDEL